MDSTLLTSGALSLRRDEKRGFERRVRVHCGDAGLRAELGRLLEPYERFERSAVRAHLLFDAPRGWAGSLDTLPGEPTIVVTDNICPEYKLDLLDKAPAALIEGLSLWEVVATLNAVRAGERRCPEVTSPLTLTERHTLKLAALGLEAKAIAKIRSTSPGTVNNTLCVIYQKLRLKSRVELTHYYLGHWHLLQGWQPPSEVRP